MPVELEYQSDQKGAFARRASRWLTTAVCVDALAVLLLMAVEWELFQEKTLPGYRWPMYVELWGVASVIGLLVTDCVVWWVCVRRLTRPGQLPRTTVNTAFSLAVCAEIAMLILGVRMEIEPPYADSPMLGLGVLGCGAALAYVNLVAFRVFDIFWKGQKTANRN